MNETNTRGMLMNSANVPHCIALHWCGRWEFLGPVFLWLGWLCCNGERKIFTVWFRCQVIVWLTRTVQTNHRNLKPWPPISLQTVTTRRNASQALKFVFVLINLRKGWKEQCSSLKEDHHFLTYMWRIHLY